MGTGASSSISPQREKELVIQESSGDMAAELQELLLEPNPQATLSSTQSQEWKHHMLHRIIRDIELRNRFDFYLGTQGARYLFEFIQHCDNLKQYLLHAHTYTQSTPNLAITQAKKIFTIYIKSCQITCTTDIMEDLHNRLTCDCITHDMYDVPRNQVFDILVNNYVSNFMLWNNISFHVPNIPKEEGNGQGTQNKHRRNSSESYRFDDKRNRKDSCVSVTLPLSS